MHYVVYIVQQTRHAHGEPRMRDSQFSLHLAFRYTLHRIVAHWPVPPMTKLRRRPRTHSLSFWDSTTGAAYER